MRTAAFLCKQDLHFLSQVNITVGHAVVQLVEALRYKPRKVTGLILDGVIGIFY